MPETYFFIQNQSFTLPDLEKEAKQFTVTSLPRPYSVTFHVASNELPFIWLKQLMEEGTYAPLLFIDSHIHTILQAHSALPHMPTLQLKAVETNKNIHMVLQLCDFLQANNANRGSMLFVVGGGITQDIGASAAALFKRGLPWTLVPTTLLSQADSCIGSKTALNHGNAKNMLGLFYAPRQVHIDLNFTDTLTRQDRLSGLGEILRLCVTGGEASFSLFEHLISSTLGGDKAGLAKLVHTALTVKTCIIEEDEYELDLRRAMNYAHTIGHAIEALSAYSIPHGVGIAIGMMVENMIAVQKGIQDERVAKRITRQAKKIIPQESWQIFKNLQLENLLPLLKNDKKSEGQYLKLALLKQIGQIVFGDLPLDINGLSIVRNAAIQTIKQY